MSSTGTPIYLHEKPHATVGLEPEYINSVEKQLYPALLKARDSLALRAVGAFKVDANGSEWPSLVFLWRYASWQAWIDERKPVSGAQADAAAAWIADSGVVEFTKGATQWRKRSTETVLVPLPFSPLPKEAPSKTAQGAVLLEQRYTVKSGHVADFVAAMEASVIKHASDSGLELQLFARTGHRPLEFAVLWSMEFDRLGELFANRQPAKESSFLPGLDVAWGHVADLTENTLLPLPFSPLGGTQ
jgi:hypothetical protein